MERKNVSTIRRERRKQGLTIDEDLEIELFEGRESLYHRLD